MLFKLLIVIILLHIISLKNEDVKIKYLVLVGLLSIGYYLYINDEKFANIENLCPPCPKCPEMPECPPCEITPDRKWDMPRWSFMDPEDAVKSQMKPKLCANPVETKTDYYTPVDYSEFLTAFEQTNVGSNLPREEPYTEYA
jgi:hypothetical protein